VQDSAVLRACVPSCYPHRRIKASFINPQINPKPRPRPAVDAIDCAGKRINPEQPPAAHSHPKGMQIEGQALYLGVAPLIAARPAGCPLFQSAPARVCWTAQRMLIWGQTRCLCTLKRVLRIRGSRNVRVIEQIFGSSTIASSCVSSGIGNLTNWLFSITISCQKLPGLVER